MENFKDLKTELLTKAKAANACTDEYKKAYIADTEEELLKVIYNNLSWCINNDCVSHEYFAKFKPEIYMISGIANNGKYNVGYWNTGNWNTGDRNTGNWNTGYRNTGDWNTGNRNTGDCNTGDWNTGNWNTGNRNTGYWNTGNRNTGDRNTGNCNTGDCNTGDCNTGYRNTGAFCTDENPKIRLFNKETNILVRDWEQSRPFQIMSNYLFFNMWIWSNEMNDKEKKTNPQHITTGGYLKNIPVKDGWLNMWGNLSEKDKFEFTSLKNFDPSIFEEITGIKI